MHMVTIMRWSFNEVMKYTFLLLNMTPVPTGYSFSVRLMKTTHTINFITDFLNLCTSQLAYFEHLSSKVILSEYTAHSM